MGALQHRLEQPTKVLGAGLGTKHRENGVLFQDLLLESARGFNPHLIFFLWGASAPKRASCLVFCLAPVEMVLLVQQAEGPSGDVCGSKHLKHEVAGGDKELPSPPESRPSNTVVLEAWDD